MAKRVLVGKSLLIRYIVFCITAIGFFALYEYYLAWYRKANASLDNVKEEEDFPIPGWEPNVTRDVSEYVNPREDTTIISGKEICEFYGTALVIIVTSAPRNFRVRSAIRNSWGRRNTNYVKVGFIVGLPQNSSVQTAIEEESAKFKDIIQDNFVDSYNNLTLKSIALLKWFTLNCPTPEFLMKADDDAYFGVTQIVMRLANMDRRSNILLGQISIKAKPIKNRLNKWYVPKYTYQDIYFPDYVSGPGYIMSRDTVLKLYEAALKTPIFHLEDVYITGICSLKAGIYPQDFKGHILFHPINLDQDLMAFFEKDYRLKVDADQFERQFGRSDNVLQQWSGILEMEGIYIPHNVNRSQT